MAALFGAFHFRLEDLTRDGIDVEFDALALGIGHLDLEGGPFVLNLLEVPIAGGPRPVGGTSG